MILLAFGLCAFGQSNHEKNPKLIVGIVVDQMRFDYLYKYESKYSEDGFKRLMREGFNFKNMHFNYKPTVTAAGHASIYTGTTPSIHGIVGNSWYDRYLQDFVENVTDSTYVLVGTQNPSTKGYSPKNLLTTTISDQLRMASNFRSKVISISLKDRGAILPGGHSANASYWHDWVSSPGYFVSSRYYMKELPSWVTDFNKEEKSNAYLDDVWNTLLPIESYTESSKDNNRYEYSLGGKPSPTFPYNLKEMRSKYKERGSEYQLLWVTPGGNSILTEFAIEAIKNEDLGKDDFTDLINISFSTPDVAGHTFGPQSIEIEDIYLRLDQNIADLLKYLDDNIGTDNYVLFLTADHAVVPVVTYLKNHKLPSGVIQVDEYDEALSQFLNNKYGVNPWVEYFAGDQVYLNRNLINEKKKIDLKSMQLDAANFLLTLEGISSVVTAEQLQFQDFNSGPKQMSQNGFYAKRSGDILLTFDPGYITNTIPGRTVNNVKGTTHGSGYNYDTHVPMLWFGSGISQGQSTRKVKITDIAPSLSMFFNLQLPSGASGHPLFEILDKN